MESDYILLIGRTKHDTNLYIYNINQPLKYAKRLVQMDPTILNLQNEERQYDDSYNFKMLKTKKYLVIFYIKDNAIKFVSKAYLDGIEMEFEYDDSLSNLEKDVSVELVYQNESVTQKKPINLRFFEMDFNFKVKTVAGKRDKM